MVDGRAMVATLAERIGVPLARVSDESRVVLDADSIGVLVLHVFLNAGDMKAMAEAAEIEENTFRPDRRYPA
jgi:hypothetical protein